MYALHLLGLGGLGEGGGVFFWGGGSGESGSTRQIPEGVLRLRRYFYFVHHARIRDSETSTNLGKICYWGEPLVRHSRYRKDAIFM